MKIFMGLLSVRLSWVTDGPIGFFLSAEIMKAAMIRRGRTLITLSLMPVWQPANGRQSPFAAFEACIC
jgi:hypothetical protein